MDLDALLGAGALAGFTETCDISAVVPRAEAEIECWDEDRGQVHLLVRWVLDSEPVGELKIDVSAEVANYTALSIEPPYRRMGILWRLVDTQPNLWAAHGVERLTLWADEDRAPIFERVGFVSGNEGTAL